MKNVLCIISVYNEPVDMLKKAIESIINQKIISPDLLIVVDAPSRRVELNFLTEIMGAKVIFNEENLGLARSLNTALHYVGSYHYVMRMDADDISDRYRLYNQIKYLIRKKLDLVGCNADFIDEHDRVISCNNSPYGKLTAGTIAFHPTWVMKSEVFISLGGYKKYKTSQDYDFLCRADLLGFDIGNLSEVYFKYRVRSTSLSGTSRHQQVFNKLFIMKNYKARSLVDLEPPVFEDSIFSRMYRRAEDKRENKWIFKILCLLSPWHIRLKIAQII